MGSEIGPRPHEPQAQELDAASGEPLEGSGFEDETPDADELEQEVVQ